MRATSFPVQACSEQDGYVWRLMVEVLHDEFRSDPLGLGSKLVRRPVISDIEFRVPPLVPREGELMYVDGSANRYYRVVRVIHDDVDRYSHRIILQVTAVDPSSVDRLLGGRLR